MLVNKDTAISTSHILLVPYEEHHVLTYHSWMQDEEIQEATASEPLTLSEEYAMQSTWRTDTDKLTFIACNPLSPSTEEGPPNSSCVIAHKDDAPDRMLGDINLFLTPAEEDPEGCIGEIELMIAPLAARRRGYGRAALLTFLKYLETHLGEILAEYSAEGHHGVRESEEEPGVEGVAEEEGEVESKGVKMRLIQLRVKIGSKNVKSINLFRSVGFIKVGEGENYFGEVELVFEGFLKPEGKKREDGSLEKRGTTEYEELKYDRLEER